MSAKYKVIFREENSPGNGSLISWEPGSPLVISAVQISRNTETSESYLQAKVLNIAAKMVSEVHAKATVQYPDGTTEDVALDDLDADIKAGDAYSFNAAALSRGDAVRADVHIVRTKTADGITWESAGEPVPIGAGGSIDLPDNYSSARMSYLAESGCNDVASAVNKVSDLGSYWVCACGQVNMSSSCARCKLDKQAALNSESIEFLDSVIAKKKEAAEKVEFEKQERKGKIKRIGIIAAGIVVAIIAAFAIASQIPQCNGTLTSSSGNGTYVVSKHSYTYDGKERVIEYELSDQGNVLKENCIKPEMQTYAYKYDDYGNVLECSGGKYPYKRSIDSVDSYGQPTKITKIDSDGDKDTIEIIWYGEGHVKQVTSKTPSIGYTSKMYFNESGEITRHEATFVSKVSGTSRYHTDYTYEHDSQGRVTSRTGKDEDGKTTTTKYEYDNNGNVVRTIENGKTVGEYEYVYIENASPFVIMENNHFMRNCGF